MINKNKTVENQMMLRGVKRGMNNEKLLVGKLLKPFFCFYYRELVLERVENKSFGISIVGGKV